MEYVLYAFAGILGGVLGGMGMGGGTILIPLLSIFYGVSQHASQAVNLISFVPMAVVALIIHIKNKLVRFDNVLIIIVSGCFTCVLGCYIAKVMSGDLLRKCFGGFLVLLSVFQIILGLKQKDEN